MAKFVTQLLAPIKTNRTNHLSLFYLLVVCVREVKLNGHIKCCPLVRLYCPAYIYIDCENRTTRSEQQVIVH